MRWPILHSSVQFFTSPSTFLEIPAQVAVTLLPTEEPQEENAARNLRFQEVMAAIRVAIDSNYTTPEISDQELNQLIHEARQAAKA